VSHPYSEDSHLLKEKLAGVFHDLVVYEMKGTLFDTEIIDVSLDNGIENKKWKRQTEIGSDNNETYSLSLSSNSNVSDNSEQKKIKKIRSQKDEEYLSDSSGSYE
jgi:hypothetical protein